MSSLLEGLRHCTSRAICLNCNRQPPGTFACMEILRSNPCVQVLCFSLRTAMEVIKKNLKNTQLFSSNLLFRQLWTEASGHFRVPGAFSKAHRSNPSPHPTNNYCWTSVSRIFSTLYRVWGGRTARKFRKGCTV